MQNDDMDYMPPRRQTCPRQRSGAVSLMALGEHTANMLRSAAVALRTCTVSFTGPSGIRHSVDVTAESVYEAAAFGSLCAQEDGWADAVALGTELEVQVREPPTCHRITVQQIHRWCDGVAVSLDETLKKRRLKQLLAYDHVRSLVLANGDVRCF
jgi:hypothetical protein